MPFLRLAKPSTPKLVKSTLLMLLALVCTSAPVVAQRKQNYPPKLKGAKEYVYKKVGDVELKAWVFFPQDDKQDEQGEKSGKPVVIFFFGGGWRSGSPKQFEQHCRYFAARGMVAVTADYRVASRHQVKAVDCVADAQDAIRWLRVESDVLGIDPDRIVASGGSAGGHLAACTGLIELESESETEPSPNAMVLFNPAVVLAPVEGQGPMRLTKEKLQELEARMGTKPEKLSPYHNLPKQTGPCLIFHGKQDSTVPYKSVELFEAAMKEAGNQAKLVGFEGKGHGFFNYGRDGNKDFVATIKAMDAFLVDLGYLTGESSKSVEEMLR